jgi:hypothetical protein
MVLIIFDPWAPTCKRQVFACAVGQQAFVDELTPVVGIDSQQRKRKEYAGLLQCHQHRVGTFIEQWHAFRPACGDIGQRQGVQEAAVCVGSAVRDQIHFHMVSWTLQQPCPGKCASLTNAGLMVYT